MIKEIKFKKNVQLRLDELIKYAFDNNITEKHFGSNNGALVIFKKDGSFKLDENFHVRPDSIFTVEVEEKIDERTQFKSVVGVLSNGSVIANNDQYNINQLRVVHPNIKQIYALIDNNLELIWEAEN